MGSTNFNAPPFKLTLAAVVALHVLAVMALTMVNTPEPVVKPSETTPPIEIQLIKSPVVIKASEIKTEERAPIKTLKPQPKPAVAPDLKPELKPKPPVAEKSQPEVKPKPPEPPVNAPIKPELKTTTVPEPKTPEPKTQPDKPKVVNNEPFRHEVKRQESITTVQADDLAASSDRKILAAQAEKAAQDAHAKAVRDAQAAADATVARAATQAADDAKAVQEAKAAADAKVAQSAAEEAARIKATAAASNTPVNFTASSANWTAQPSFSFPNRAKRSARSGDIFEVVLVLRVNKQGGIDSVRLAQSSGNAILDREAQRQVRSGKFRPFIKNNVAVVGNVTLPITYKVP